MAEWPAWFRRRAGRADRVGSRGTSRSEPIPTPVDPATRVVLLVRDGCHLCLEAAAVASAECDPRQISWEQVDVDDHPELRAAYTDHVPVTFVDGQRLSYWGLDPALLRSALG